MTAGAAPEPPDRGWRVLYEGPLSHWILQRPLLGSIGAVTEWIRAIEVMGPPREALDTDEGELVTTEIPGSTAEVGYLVVVYERLVIIRSITGG